MIKRFQEGQKLGGFLDIFGSFCVDHGGEGPLEAECNNIYNPNIEGNEDASWLLVPESGSKETKGAPDVHWVF